MNFIDKLNDAQKDAACHVDGPSMVIAGAGSGKTRVLTYRIAKLIDSGIDPNNILALTFTNKAAKEMKERISQLVGYSNSRALWMGTFHSIFARILRYEAEKIGFTSSFTIYDTQDSKNLLKDIIKQMNLDDKLYKPATIYNRISNSKNNLISEKAYLNNPKIQNDDKLANRPFTGEIYSRYQSRMLRSNAMDFDDLLFKTNVLFRDSAETLSKYQYKFQFILVDEYQDTNYSQYLIVKKLAALNENIMVVGDDAQSIYGFRGANISNILNFKNDYSDCKEFFLEQNYRSTKNIVNLANGIIKKNIDQIEKNVWTENNEGNKIKVLELNTDNEEGREIAFDIKEKKQRFTFNYNDFAILYRTNFQSRAFEEQLRKLNIPYKIYGGTSFYQRMEIKDTLAYFRLISNNYDEEALKRIINVPIRGIGATSIAKLTISADENNTKIWDLLRRIDNYNTGLNSSIKMKIREFFEAIKYFSIQANEMNVYDLCSEIVKKFKIMSTYFEDDNPESMSRYENINELLNGIKDFEVNYIKENNSNPKLNDFLIDVALLTDIENEDESEEEKKNKVSMMTIHASKGLEFKNVYVVGMEENLFPSSMSMESAKEIEEERRLFYVATTRAEENLTLSYSKTRYKFGKIINNDKSRFLDELNFELIEDQSSKLFAKKQNKLNDNFESNFELNLKKLKKVSELNASTILDSNTYEIGENIEHQKFGKGKIINIEGEGKSQKAIINFQNEGNKTIMLAFAKLNKIDNI